jgi:hypothetical protein
MSGAGWTDTKPSIAAVDHLSLPHLQDQQGDWKGWSLSSQQQQQRGPSLAPLPGLTPSQGSGYGLPASMWSNTSGGGYIPSWNGDARSKNFVPDGIEVALRTSEGNKYGISKSGLVVGDPIRVNEIRSVQTRYAILSQISPSEGISVYHIDVPLLLGARAADRQALFQNQPDLELTTSFRPNSDAHGWILSTESGQVTFGDPYQPMLHFARSSSNLKGTNGRCTSVTSLPDVAALYHQVALQDRMQPVGSEPLDTLPIFIPQTAVMQRVVRYNTPPPRYNMMGADWINSTCILVYSFSVPSDPNASTTCRPVILDTDNTSPRHHIDPAASSAIVSELLAGETSEPSKFMFPPTQ